MRQLTTKQYNGILLSLYFLFFLAILSTTFFFVFRLAFILQIKKEMSSEINRVFNNYIATSDGNIVFTLDSEGNDLRDELIKTGFSGLFLDADINAVRGFGLFSLYSTSDKGIVIEIVQTSREVVSSKKVVAKSVMWQGQEIYAYFVPIIVQGEVKGVAILGKTLREIDTVTNVLIITFVTFGILAIFASFVLGKALVTRLFAPISKFTKLIESIDLEGPDKNITIKGNPKDDLVILGQKFNEMVSRLKASSIQEKEFISNVSHELKTPLTKAISSIEVFSLSPEITQNHFEEIKNDLLDMNTLIDKLLFLSRLDKNTIKKDEITKVLNVVKEAFQKLYDDFQEKNISFKATIADDIYINLPQEYAYVLFSNILSNALKYSENGANVSIVASKDALGKTVVEIEDTGIGMSPNEVQSAFERFHRLNDGKKHGSGSGIGLSIVKRICELYDIKMDVKSEKGKGTKFSLYFS